MPIRRVTSMPPRLSGTVGKSAINRPHDVALVQALLGEVKDRGRPILKDHVTGRFDRDTEQAVATLFKVANDRSPNQRLATGHPLLQKISQNQSLTVVEGTSAPYQVERAAYEPRIAIRAGLMGFSDDERSTLLEIASGLSKEFGIRFDLSIAQVHPEPDTLFCYFKPRGCTIHAGNRWCRGVNTPEQLRAANRNLHEILANAIQIRVSAAFGIKDAADLAVNARLKDEFAAVIRPQVAASLARVALLLEGGRALGLDLAVRLFEHYLAATGSDFAITRDEALAFELIQTAVAANIERFKTDNFIAPAADNVAWAAIFDLVAAGEGQTANFDDYWKYDFNNTAPSIERYRDSFDRSLTSLQDLGSVLLGPGSSHLTSTGKFNLAHQDDGIAVEGTVTHRWADEGYNFELSKMFGENAARLEASGHAKPFSWYAEWQDEYRGHLIIHGVPAFGQYPLLRWQDFRLAN
jgi:hypothetical protein